MRLSQTQASHEQSQTHYTAIEEGGCHKGGGGWGGPLCLGLGLLEIGGMQL